MVSRVWIYFEGDATLRPGFHAFFQDLVSMARARRIRFRMVAGEATAVADFARGMRSAPADTHVLLIDSEGPIEQDPVSALMRRGDAGALASVAITPDQVFFMVQVMEAWFLADVQALHDFYGQGFVAARLPARPRVEGIPKADVLDGLREATKGTSKGAYHKTRHAPDLLARLSVGEVRACADNCARIFAVLGRILDSP